MGMSQSLNDSKEIDKRNRTKYTVHEFENSITINKLDYLKVKILDMLSSNDLNSSIRTSKSKESLFNDSLWSSGTMVDHYDQANYATEIKSHREIISQNNKWNTVFANKTLQKGNTYDNKLKESEDEYEEPQSLNLNSDTFIKPIKFNIEDEEINTQKIKELETEIKRLKSCEIELSRQKYTIKTLKELVNKLSKPQGDSLMQISELTSIVILQAKLIEDIKPTIPT